MSLNNFMPTTWSKDLLRELLYAKAYSWPELVAQAVKSGAWSSEYEGWHEQYGVWEPDMMPYAAANDPASCGQEVMQVDLGKITENCAGRKLSPFQAPFTQVITFTARGLSAGGNCGRMPASVGAVGNVGGVHTGPAPYQSAGSLTIAGA